MVPSIRLGGTASEVEIANVAHGLMFMTWTPNSVPDEQAFRAIREGVDAAGGAKVLLNSGEFYGHGLTTANLELLARFYTKHPDYAEKTVLCVKGGMEPGSLTPVATEENIRRSIDNINAKLRGTKRVDIFENARVDTSRPIEETVWVLKKLIQEGKFDHIGLSECSSETLRRANAVHPIASVEIEVSPWSYEEETRKVISTARELQLPVLAYSPLGRGLLKMKTAEEIPDGDIRRGMERFYSENLGHNRRLINHLTDIAQKRNVTPSQLSIAWVLSLGPHMIPMPGSSKYTRTVENLAAGDIILTAEERASIIQVISSFEIKGSRYTQDTPYLWG